MGKTMVIKLSDPGMTPLHKVGLAGLYMTLKKLPKEDFAELGDWEISSKSVKVSWKKTPKEFFSLLMEKSFLLDKNGVIKIYAHRDHKMGDEKRVLLHNILLKTFFQHGTSGKKVGKKGVSINLPFDEKEVQVNFDSLLSYKHQPSFGKNSCCELAFNSKGQFNKKVKLVNSLLPGGGVRHVGFSSASTLTSSPKSAIVLFFTIVGTLYYSIKLKGPDGKYDNRKMAALIFPSIDNLENYEQSFFRYLSSSAKELYAGEVGDAALKAMLALNLHTKERRFSKKSVKTCFVQTMGNVSWNKQQKCRTSSFFIRGINESKLNLFDTVLSHFSNEFRVSKDNIKYIVVSSTRTLIANNIIEGRDWYHNFKKIVSSKKLVKSVMISDRKGLAAMLSENVWSENSDKTFVEAIHIALKNRYGAIAARAKKTNENPGTKISKEFEKIRSSLMRAKNLTTLRAEIADLFSRGGINKTLQENWQQLLHLYSGSDWQKTRDLTLLALVSYSGKNSENIQEESLEE